MDTSSELPDYLEEMKAYYGLSAVLELSVALYDAPVKVEKEDEFVVPDEAKLIFYSNKSKGIHKNFFGKENCVFNPREQILPSEFFDKDYGCYIFVPLYNRKMNYGYIAYRFYSQNYSLMSIFGKILSNSLLQSYFNYQSSRQRDNLLKENQNLNITAKIDDLSQLFNRRGFFEYGQMALDLWISMDKNGGVFFCDLDDLKKINDNFGHDMGDVAIQTAAQIFKTVFRESDIVARLSGDEFGIIAPGLKSDYLCELRKKLARESERLSKEKNLPFIVSASVGCAEFGKENSNLSEILATADEKLYEEKRIKHGKSQNNRKF